MATTRRPSITVPEGEPGQLDRIRDEAARRGCAASHLLLASFEACHGNGTLEDNLATMTAASKLRDHNQLVAAGRLGGRAKAHNRRGQP